MTNITPNQAKVLNDRIRARYEGLSFDTKGIHPDTSKNHTRGARRHTKRRTIR